MLRTALALLLMSTILIAAPRGRGKAKADPVAPKIDSKFVHAKTFTPDGKRLATFNVMKRDRIAVLASI